MKEPAQLRMRIQATSNRKKNLSRFVIGLADEIKKQVDAEVEITSGASWSALEKSPTSIDWNTLLITLAASGGVLTTLINIIREKITKDKTITIEIEGKKLSITGVNIHSDNLNKLIDEFTKTTTNSPKRINPMRGKYGKSK